MESEIKFATAIGALAVLDKHPVRTVFVWANIFGDEGRYVAVTKKEIRAAFDGCETALCDGYYNTITRDMVLTCMPVR